MASMNMLRFIIGLFLIVLVVLLGIIGLLIKKIRDLSKVRYGFGGKPLFSSMVVFGLLCLIPVTLYASQRPIEYLQLARAPNDVETSVFIMSQEGDRYQVAFMAVPIRDEKQLLDAEYTVRWVIEGAVTFEKVEEGRSAQRQSYFIETLRKGEYDMSLEVILEDFQVSRNYTFVIDETSLDGSLIKFK